MENIQNLPIDIQTSKLLDWLVDRRHCSLKWQNAVMVIREKISAALQDMPENEEIKQLLMGTLCDQFYNWLGWYVKEKETLDQNEKSIYEHFILVRVVMNPENIPGTPDMRYTLFPLPKDSGNTKGNRSLIQKYIRQDWQEIVSLYEKDNAHLAELASLLSRSVCYEGPALRKQVAKAQQLQQELSRRELECQSGAADMRERYYAACKQYGITGENVARELQALVKDLPTVLEETGRKAACLEQTMKLYTAFTKFVCDWSEPVLPMLSFIQQKGNTTVYEWKTGNIPTVIERPVVEEAPPDTVTEETIDWGDLCSSAEEVNFGTTAEEGVDWGITLGSGKEETGDGGIDWGETETAAVEIEVVAAGTDCPEGVARGQDALSLLENPQTRNQFIDELIELEVFLCQRLSEMSEEGDMVAMSQFQLAPSIIQGQTRERVQAMLADVRHLLEGLTSLRMKHLFMIQASPRYVERVSDMLRQKLKQADILMLKQACLAERRQEALEEQARLEPRIDLLAAHTKELQKLIEADISKRYNNRPVNLMGVHV